MKSLAWVALVAACSGGHDAPVADSPAAPDAVTPDTGSGLPTPIKYVVVIVKENHSFDNYFTNFPGAESSMTAKLHDGTVITRQKAEAVVMVSLSDWNAMEETLHLLSNPKNAGRLRDSVRQLDAGQGTERALAQP